VSKKAKAEAPQAEAPQVVVQEFAMIDPTKIVLAFERGEGKDGINTGRYKVAGDEKVEEIGYSMHVHGQLTNVQVTDNGDGTYGCVFGNTRTLAARKIREGYSYQGREILDPEFKLKALVVKGTPRQQFEANITENVSRAELTVMDRAVNIRDAKEVHKMSTPVICQLLGIDKATVSRYLTLLKLPGSIQDLIHDGKLGLSHGCALATWNKGQLTEEQMVKAYQDCQDDQPSLTQLEKVLREIKTTEVSGATDGKPEGETSSTTPSKPETTTTTKRRTLSDVIAKLREGIIRQDGSYPGVPNAGQCKLLDPLFTNLTRYAEGDPNVTEKIVSDTLVAVATAIRKKFKEQSWEDTDYEG